MRNVSVPVAVLAAFFVMLGPAVAAPVYYGPVPYLSPGDVPAGFYAGGSGTALEDFESLSFGPTSATTALGSGMTATPVQPTNAM